MPRLVVASSVFVFALVGCRVAPTTKTDPLPQPQPQPDPIAVEEPEPSDSPALPVAFGYVTMGGDRETGLPQVIDKGGPAWIADVGAFEQFAPEFAGALERSGIGVAEDEPASSDAIDPRMVVAAGYGPPAPTIWLVDDEGACEARIATPHVAIYFEIEPTVEISWRLEGCDPSRAWAPIGLFTVAPPERLRYLESVVTFSDAIDLASYSGRGAAKLREFGSGFDNPDEYWVRELAIPDTEIAQVQFAGLWRDHPARGEEYNDCEEMADVVDWTGRWRESGFEEYPLGLEDSPWVDDAELVGAFVIEGDAKWLVFSESMQALVITPGAEPQTLITGSYHDEVVAFTGWSPASSCEP